MSDEQTPHKVSAGLMQTLISTAREAMQMSVDREWLLRPANSIEAGTAYIARQAARRGSTRRSSRPPTTRGGSSTRTGAENRWKLRQYPIGTGKHCDRFVRFFNDAVARARQPLDAAGGLLQRSPRR